MEKKITFQELAERLSNGEIDKKKAEAFTRLFFEVIEEGLVNDKFVKVKGFGTFKLVEVSERESVSVNTGERIQISGHTKVSFTPDNQLKDLVNRPFSHFETVILNEGVSIADLERADEVVLPAVSREAEAEPEVNDEAKDEDIADADAVPETPAKTDAATETETLSVVESTEESTPEAGRTATTDAENETVEENCPSGETGSPAEEPILILEENDAAEEIAGTSVSAENEAQEESVVPEQEKRSCVWCHILCALVVILLMAGSYAAGHFHLLGEFTATAPSEEPVVAATDSTTVQDTIAQPQPRVQQSASPRPAEPTPDEPTEVAPKDAPQTAPEPFAPATEEENAASEAKHAKLSPKVPVKIVGTYDIHTVRNGETLRSIALKVYGSKLFSKQIQEHNNLPDANAIRVGMILNLPELVPAE